MRAIVIGGGIGGLTTAIALRAVGVEVEVFEQALELREIGAGMGITTNATIQLYRLGMGDTLNKIAIVPEWISVRRWQDGSTLQQFKHQGNPGTANYSVYRADLLRMLAAKLPASIVTLDHRLVALRQLGNRVEAEFHNGTTATGDFLVGADGIHSSVRKAVWGAFEPHFSELVAFRGVIPIEQLPEHFARETRHTIWWGPGRIFHEYRANSKYWAYVADVPSGTYRCESWKLTGSKEEFLSQFFGWHPRIQEIIQAVDTSGKLAMFDHDTLARWTDGRVTLLGDAAHAMLHFLGQGACQAIEDAVVLAKCLERKPLSEVPNALLKYEEIRKPRTTRCQQANRQHMQQCFLPDGKEQQERDAALASGQNDNLTWLFAYDAHAEAEFAITKAVDGSVSNESASTNH